MVNHGNDKSPKEQYQTYDAEKDKDGFLGTDFSLADEMRKSHQIQIFS